MKTVQEVAGYLRHATTSGTPQDQIRRACDNQHRELPSRTQVNLANPGVREGPNLATQRDLRTSSLSESAGAVMRPWKWSQFREVS
jgi:hypothetical protein